MFYRLKLSHEFVRLRAPMVAALVLAIGACDNGNSFNADSSTDPTTQSQLSGQGPYIEEDTPITPDTWAQDSAVAAEVASGALAPAGGLSLSTTSTSGGIPAGIFALPNSEFGSRYDGAVRIIWVDYLVSNLAAIKSRGGKVVLNLAGGPKQYTDANGHFSLSMWKARVDAYRKVNFSSYISDGTIIGHLMMDEPNDPTNWNGQVVSPATVEAMAQYSKQIWPGMPTLVRTTPMYLSTYSGTFQYLDGAWAQYVTWKGDVNNYLSTNVAAAQKKGLSLVVGLNILKGGTNGSAMTGSQVQTFGTALLSSSYPCAFLSWNYSSSYLSNTAIKSAMDVLRSKAQNRAFKSCRGA